MASSALYDGDETDKCVKIWSKVVPTNFKLPLSVLGTAV
jgi:hypothetical protein